jgi:hypothetical protein
MEKNKENPESVPVYDSQVEDGDDFDVVQEEPAFSNEDTEKANKAADYGYTIKRIERGLEYLSGGKKAEAEKDLELYKKEKERLLDFTAEKIKKLPNSLSLLAIADPTDMEFLDRIKEGGAIFSDDREKMEYYYADSNKKSFCEYLQVNFGLYPIVSEQIYRKICEEKKQQALSEMEFEKTKFDAVTRDQVNADEIKKTMGIKSRETKAAPDYFDPDEELEKIKDLRQSGSENFNPDEKRQVVRGKIADFRKRLAEQMDGFTEINSKLETMILEDSKIDAGRLREFIEEQAKKYKLSPVQLKKYNLFFDRVAVRNDIIQGVAEQYSGKNDEEIFEDLFGAKSEGKVEVEKGSLSIFIKCYDLRDYALVNQGKPFSQLSQEEKLRVEKSAGCANIRSQNFNLPSDSLMAANLGIDFSSPNFQEIKVHEEKHVLNSIMREVEHIGKYSKVDGSIDNDPENEERIRRTFQEDRVNNEDWAKNEILAYLKEGRLTWQVETYLNESEKSGGLYDYFGRDEQHYETHKRYTRFNSNLVEQVSEDEKYKYYQNIKKSLKVTNNLEAVGFSREEIVALLQLEPIGRWPKIFERFKEGQEFKKRKEEILDNLEKGIGEAKKDIGGMKERIEKEKRTPGFVRKIDDFLYSIGKDKRDSNPRSKWLKYLESNLWEFEVQLGRLQVEKKKINAI